MYTSMYKNAGHILWDFFDEIKYVNLNNQLLNNSAIDFYTLRIEYSSVCAVCTVHTIVVRHILQCNSGVRSINVCIRKKYLKNIQFYFVPSINVRDW